jgi:hypothetical protein
MGGGRRLQYKPLAKPESSFSMFGGIQVCEEPLCTKKPSRHPEAKENVSKNKSRSGKAEAKGRQCTLAVTVQELHMALLSLYDDELKPYGRILRKRLAEQGVNTGKEVDLVQLRRFCEQDKALCVESEEGGEWSALFINKDTPFVDVYSKEDLYDEAIWESAARYFEALSEEEGVLPGGRYACAQTLSSRRLSFFAGFTLGRICHFVQIAISTRKVLGYLNGGITSYNRSHSCMKDSAATQNQSCAQAAIVSSLRIASWKDARKCLKSILSEALKNGQDQVPLSNIKRICRSKYEIELSETTLGHSKLSDFLQDAQLADICTVKLLEQGYFVIPQFGLGDGSDSETASSEASMFNFDDEALQLELPDIAEDSCETPFWPDQMPRQSPAGAKWYSMSPRARMVQNTFIHAPTTPLVQMGRRSNSVPRNVGVCRSPLLRPPTAGRSPMTTALTPLSVASPLDQLLLPQTPDQWTVETPGASPYPHALHSVPETQPVESEKFNWADHEFSGNAFGCSLDDFPPMEIDVQALPASPSPFGCREAPLLAGLRAPPVALCLSNHL